MWRRSRCSASIVSSWVGGGIDRGPGGGLPGFTGASLARRSTPDSRSPGSRHATHQARAGGAWRVPGAAPARSPAPQPPFRSPPQRGPASHPLRSWRDHAIRGTRAPVMAGLAARAAPARGATLSLAVRFAAGAAARRGLAAQGAEAAGTVIGLVALDCFPVGAALVDSVTGHGARVGSWSVPARPLFPPRMWTSPRGFP